MDHYYFGIGESWFDYQELYSEMVNKFSDGSHFVEVGSWKGRSSVYMGVEIINSGKKIKFDCVDNWEYLEIQKDIPKSSYDNLYEIFLSNIEPIKEVVKPVRSLSWDGANFYEDNSLDFVFIDAAHDYESVCKDIKAWFPKVKNGGVIAGHDYFNAESVRNAVKDSLPDSNFTTKGSCWVYNK